ncbi:MAG: Ig-like domain-containing protein, partial [Gammaproteobacteria bacterium]|nr:Ig-like domain-containing protein [Gammaproteobacteria bacterium]
TTTGGGTWSITVPAIDALNEGSYDVGVTSTDAAGNSSTDATTNELTIDTAPPLVAIGSAPTANIANSTNYPVSGTCTNGDGDISIAIAGATPPADSVSCVGGNWNATFDVSAIADGNTAIAVTASQTDAAGNAGNDSQSADKDTIAPALSITDNGSGGDDTYTLLEAATASVSGTTDAENGQLVTVSFSDGVSAPVSATASTSGGSWTTSAVDISGLNTGTISITADVNDAASNPAPQASDTVTYANVSAPLLTADDVPATNNSLPTFSGTTDQQPAQLVTVRDDLGTAVCAAAPVVGSPTNSWSCTTNSAISEGNYTFTAEVDDGLGNSQVVGFSVSIDFDADNDGLPDAVEGVADTDGDGMPDFLDPDSDNDGIPDGEEDTGLSPLSGNDSDGDGLDDAIDVDATGGADADGNGIDDLFEVSDLDGDGLPDYLDTDTDNDGIPDRIEGNVDSDGDGVPDFRDTDSDNDGIPDAIEDSSTPPLSGNDSDFDGIDDAIDVDNTGGNDLNGDGIDDAFTPTDSDADGLPDHVDPDSNNDGVPDAFGATDTPTPGPIDSDGDGLPDYLETDSDGDGIPDTVETGAAGVDSDFDGIDDEFDVDQTGGTDADGDGIDDAVPPDFDNDSIPNLQDLDSDNDGVFDVTEAGLPDDDGDGHVDDGSIADPPPDTDGVGAPDYLDLDSDGDGTNDIVGTNAEPFDGDGDGQIDPENAADADGDGIPNVIDPNPGGVGPSDDFDGDGVVDSADIDDDNDGIPDGEEMLDGSDRDTDGDTLVDRLDLDSDGDGIPDSIEGFGSSALDADADGVVDDTVDVNSDGLADSVPTTMTPVDTDRDGVPDFQDLDSDGDNLADSVENGDFDNDGFPDNLQADGGLETAVTGIGGSSMDVFSLTLLGFWLVLRRLRGSHLSLPLVLLIVGMVQTSGPAQAAENCEPGSDSKRLACWYVGAGAGITRVDPEGESNGWLTSDDNSEGFKLLVGYRFKPRWFAELAYTDAGKAELDNLNPAIIGTPNIGYDMVSLFAGYWLRDPQSIWNLYGKAGISAILNDANDARVSYDKQTSVQLALGLGGQWRITQKWFARVELDSFDRDARYLGLYLGLNLGQ